MRYLRYAALVAILVLGAGVGAANAQVRVAVGVGIGAPAYVGPAPVCAYGYYGYYPYACAPYGYYAPRYFVNGVFIGAGPWFRGYGRGYGPVYRGPVYGGWDRDDFRRWDRDDHDRRDFDRGREFHGGNEFHGNAHGGSHGRR